MPAAKSITINFDTNISKCYRFPLKKTFTKNVFLEFAKLYLEAPRPLW